MISKAHEQDFIFSLIKDDLIHSRLLLGLEALGLRTEGYTIGLSERVFELMGIADDEVGEGLYERYLEMRERVLGLPPGGEAVEGLAREVYAMLRRR